MFDILARQQQDERRGDRTFTLQTPPWQIGARALRNSTQSINSATITAVSFSGVAWDTDTMWAAGSPTRLTINTAGYYLVSGHVTWFQDPTGERRVSIRYGGSTYICHQAAMAITTGGPHRMSTTTAYLFTAGTYIELMVYQDSGAPLVVNSVAGATPELVAHRLV